MAKQEIKITLKVNELEYEVRNRSYLMGRAKEYGDDYRNGGDMQANGDDESRNVVLRCISNAWKRLKRLAGEYLQGGVSSADNSLMSGNRATLSMTLLMPSNYDTNCTEELVSTAHRYVVDHTLGEWLGLTDKPDAEEYVRKAEDDAHRFIDALNRRRRPRRPTFDEDSVGPWNQGDGDEDIYWVDSYTWADSGTWVER